MSKGAVCDLLLISIINPSVTTLSATVVSFTTTFTTIVASINCYDDLYFSFWYYYH